MGDIERRGKDRKRKRDLRRAILAAVQGAALIGTALAAPNLPGALYRLGLLRLGGDTSTIARARRDLLRRGLLKKDERGRMRLTADGERQLALLQARDALHMRARRWDGRWRVLIFDIPEYRKSVRNKMRKTLHAVGFFRLQDSVWIYPHDCEDFVSLLKADFKIGKDVLYMIVDELENDVRIRREFGLEKRR